MDYISNLNWVHIAVCTLIYFAIGSIWYSPVLFSKIWMAQIGNLDQEKGKKQMPMLFANAFICGGIASFGIALLISMLGITSMGAAIKLALVCGGCFGFTSLSMSYMFGQRSITLLLIDSLYHIVSLVVVAIVFSVWH